MIRTEIVSFTHSRNIHTRHVIIICKKPEMKSKCKNRGTQIKKLGIYIQPNFASDAAELIGSDIPSVSNSMKKWGQNSWRILCLTGILITHFVTHFIIYLKFYAYFYIRYQSLSIVSSISVAYIVSVQIWQRANALDKIWTEEVYGRRTEGTMLQLMKLIQLINDWTNQ